MAVSEAEVIGAALSDRYAIAEVLGHGSSATVFLATDLRHHRRVALKVLSTAAGETLGVERFQREILTAARLQHPNILPLFDSGTAAGRLWYTMPFVESGSLRDRLARERQLSVAATIQLVREVAEALTYAHALGVIHRDIKPENIMLSAEGHALMADFGLARALEDELGPSFTGAGIVVGTPLYMSPEQALGESRVDARADVYALATVAYEMLAGATPFEGDTALQVMSRRVVEPPPSARLRRPNLPRGTDAVLMRALARNPAERYPTAADFATALATGEGGRAGGSSRGSFARRRRLALSAAAAVLALAAALALSIVPRRAARPDVPVIAVLPFKNLGAADDQYFADGLTEEITSRLATVPGLRVISRTSADQYRNSGKKLGQIGDELGASHVLEGSVRWERGRDGSGPAPGDAAAHPGSRRWPPVGRAVRCRAGAGVRGADPDRGASDGGPERGPRDTGTYRDSRGRHRRRRGL
ncbi:MAG TPA: serine/threonine-protein kinase [Gemmatimonadales bacterium]|nr:serine/threonine-protein kinase [Gemmatimonadales bacterium]